MKKGEGWYENFLSLDDSKELNMYNCGKRLQNLNHNYGPSVTKYFLLVYVKEGSATLYSHKDKIKLSPGNLLVMFPDAEVHYVSDKNVPWTISWIGIYGSKVPSLMEKMGISANEPVYNVKNRYETQDILDKIYTLSYSNEYSDKLAIKSLLYEFFSVLLSEESISTKNYAAEVMQLLRRNFDKDVSVEEIANRFNINKNYLTRIFKEKYGVTVKDCLIDLRIDRAKELLASSNYNVLKISNSIGYADPLYFSRIFKKKTGLSPSEYRKEFLH